MYLLRKTELKPTRHNNYIGYLLSAVAGFALMTSAHAGDLPTGGQIVAGSGSINQSGNTMTVNQTSDRLAADWQSFSIGQGNNVNFIQPSVNSIALNRVLGSDVSVIQGALTSNGKIFLVNPNGVLFTPTAQVNTGGIVASTLQMKTEDFLAGNYTFEGDSSNAIINQGNIQAINGGTIALIAAQITNNGNLIADEGNVLLGAGSKVIIDFGGPVKLNVDKGVLQAIINQGGAIRADGGNIYLTAKAANELATAVINHTGITEARTLVTGKKGQIILQGDKDYGTAHLGGTFDASAPNGGDGGLIETSAANVVMDNDMRVTAGSVTGANGTWLIDPYNYTIDATAAANIATALATTNVTISTAVNTTAQGSNGNSASIGDITISSAITKTSGTAAILTLQAANSIVVNAPISSTSGALSVVLDADNNAGARDGAGIIILNSNISTNGGSLAFGTGATATVNGVTTQVGGDVYVGGVGSTAITLSTLGGSVIVNGEMLIADTAGLTINSAGGNVTFGGVINSGDTYVAVSSSNISWANARIAAKGATGGAGAVGDTYLATITSRIENGIASRTMNYQPGWLGGQRVTGIGTNNLWRWITGPEGLQDSGNGLGFFTQNGSNTANGTGGTAFNGGYSNWNGGEPNNNGGANLTVSGESALQFVGNLGQWNDLSATGSLLNFYLQETNLAPSPLTVNAGGGTITFSSPVGNNKPLASLDVTAATIAINGGAVTTVGTQNYNGAITLGAANTLLNMIGADTDFTLGAGRTITNAFGGMASLTIETTRGINMAAGSAINSPTQTLNTLLWADSDGTNGGDIWLNNAGITTHGGSITLSGGTDTTTGYATGVAGVNSNGITLDTASLNSGGGNIILRGKSATTGTAITNSDGSAATADGISMHGGNTIDSGIGTIAITGIAQAVDTSSNGIETNITGYSKILSASTSANAITILGDASAGASANGWGTFLWGTNTSGIVLAATGNGGGVSLNGIGRNGTSNAGGTHIEPNAFILASSGPIAITGTKGTSSAYEDVVLNGTVGFASTLPAGFGITSPVTASSSNITITADSLGADHVFGGGSFAGSAVQSSGIVTIAPRTTGKAISVQTANPGGTDLWVDPTHIFGGTNLFKTGFSKVVFGNSTVGDVTLNNYVFDNDTEIDTGGNAILGASTIAAHTLAVNMTGSGTITNTGAVAVSKLALNGATSAATVNNAGNAIGTVAANVASLGLTNLTALTIGTVNALNGINATGTINVATLAGDLTVAQNISTTSTANNAVVLNAGQSTAAGTATGGNILLSGAPSITVGAGGRETFYTGSITGSPGVTALAGAGHYRYDSDETTTNYTTALGTGAYTIYRENSVITVTANNDGKTYDGLAYNGGNGVVYGGFVNGETSAILTGSLTYGGTAQNDINAGSYTITPGGLSNGLGYTISNINGTLSVAKQNLNVMASQTITYGTNVPTGTLSYSGFVLSEDQSVIDTAPSIASVNSGIVNAGTYVNNYTPSGGLDNNYSFTFSSGNLVVLKKDINVVAANQNIYYGTPVPGGSVSYSGLIAGDTGSSIDVAPTLASANSGILPAGNYAGNYTVSGGSDNNYILHYITGDLGVNKVILDVIAANQSIIQGNPVPSSSFTISGFVNGENNTALTSQPVLTTTVGGIPVAGQYLNAYSLSGAAAANYAFNYVNGTLTVRPDVPQSAAITDAQLTALYNAIQVAQKIADFDGLLDHPPLMSGGMSLVYLNSSLLMQNTKSTDPIKIGEQKKTPGFLKVFVVDGGVKLPSAVLMGHGHE
jgi:filamentous hemagglutinin family protein